MNPVVRQIDHPNSTPDPAPPTTSPAELLNRNLAAVAEVDRALAERLSAVSLTDCFSPAIGRDGSRTLKRKHPDGNTSWLGRTSMPTVSGPALLENFDHRGGNIALHGLGQGCELALLTQRIKPHQTIFAVDPDPIAAAGVLALHDLAAVIRHRQVVLLIGDDATDQLLQFLENHPGFEPPERFPQWPWHPPVEIAGFKSALEDLHRVLGQHRQARIGELAAKIREARARPPTSRKYRGGPARPPTSRKYSGGPAVSPGQEISRCLLISRRFDAVTADVANDLMAAGRAEGWSMAEVTWHRPGRTSELLLLSEIHRTAPQFLLLLNELPAQLGGILAPDLPVVCWFLEPKHTLCLADVFPSPNTIILAESPETACWLRDAGIDTDTLIILPPGAGSSADAAQQSGSACPPAGTADPPRQAWDVACIADAVDLSAEARGVTLGSLAVIWKSLTANLANQADRAEAGNLEQMLDAGAGAGRLRISDRRVRRDLLGRLEFEAAETILVRHYLGVLVKAGVRVRLWGNGWEADHKVQPVWAGPRPDSAQKLRIFAHSPLVLDCCIRERLSRDTLSATLAGAIPLVRGRFAPARPPRLPIGGQVSSRKHCRARRQAGGGPATRAAQSTAAWPDGCHLRELELPTYLRAEQLVRTVAELLAKPDHRAHLAESIAAKVRAGHSASHRLDAVARLLADRGAC